MGRSQIFEGLFAAITGDAALMTLLGPRAATNLRVYRNYAQLQSLLIGPPRYEPATAEGWLVIEEIVGGRNIAQTQYDTHFEMLDVTMHVYATHYGLGDDIADRLDALFSWTVEQQRDVQYGNYYVIFTRAVQSSEQWAEAITLAQKTRQYRLELVLAEQVA